MNCRLESLMEVIILKLMIMILFNIGLGIIVNNVLNFLNIL